LQDAYITDQDNTRRRSMTSIASAARSMSAAF
jgi:hypothetical protein